MINILCSIAVILSLASLGISIKTVLLKPKQQIGSMHATVKVDTKQLEESLKKVEQGVKNGKRD